MIRTVFLFALFSMRAVAVTSSDLEIRHLIKFVETTECKYERNGDMHTGKEAAEHIKKKYDYFKDKIVTAEDFIELSATKSALSGKQYHVYCQGVAVQDSKQWLLKELRKFRK